MSMKLAQSRTTRNATEKRSGAITEERLWVVNEVLSRGATIPPSHAYWRSGGMEQPPQAPEQRRRERKYAAHRIHEVERAVPLTSASAPHATTLARQPCRNLARMLVLRLKNLAYSLFFSRDYYFRFPSKQRLFSFAIARVFHLENSGLSRIPVQGAGTYHQRHRACRHNDITHAVTKAPRMPAQQHRSCIHGGIAHGVTTASRTSPQQHRVCCYNSSLKSSAVRGPTRKI